MENNKKTYLTPVLQWNAYDEADVITASNLGGGDNGFNDGDIPELFSK